MPNVKIVGAGSIGNHLAFACRNKNWDVLVCDIDQEALNRMKKDIYPVRYGKWDDKIELSLKDEVSNDFFDLTLIGTPPESHLSLAMEELKKENPPKVLLMEKPVCGPSLSGADEVNKLADEVGTFVCVGYNHTLTENTMRIAEILSKDIIGKPLTISAQTREHWGGIFSAHPWLKGPQDTYLGYWKQGGGACGEHSHAINIWQYFADICGFGRITKVSAMMDIVDDSIVSYDQLCLLNVTTEFGFIGNIIQDVITEPASKKARIQGEDGFVEWIVNIDGDHDAIRYWDGKGDVTEQLIPKTRPQDFEGEINHIEEILENGNPSNSPIAFSKGLDTMLVISAAYLSAQESCTVQINYDQGYTTQALELIK